MKSTDFGEISPFGSVEPNSNSTLDDYKVVVFIVGGTTYFEYKELMLYAKKNKNLTIYLGSDKLLNSQQFLDIINNEREESNFNFNEAGEKDSLLKKIR